MIRIFEVFIRFQLEVETDFEKRNLIRSRLMEVKKQKKDMREAQAKKREDDREMAIRNKAANADLQKKVSKKRNSPPVVCFT